MWTSTAPGMAAICFMQLRGELVVALAAAGDLEIDGRGQAEVEDLVGDVGGREEEGAVGELLREIGADEALYSLVCGCRA